MRIGVFVLFLVGIISCSPKEEKKIEKPVEPLVDVDTVVQKVVEVQTDTLTVVKKEYREVVPDSIAEYINLLENKVDYLSQEVISLKTTIAKQESSVARDRVEVPSEIQQMVIGFLTSMETFVEKKDPDLVIKYFLPEFNINGVQVDTASVASIVSADHFNFRKRLKATTRQEGYSYDFDEPRYMHYDQKGELFTTTFEAVEKVSLNGEQLYSSDYLITVSGRIKEEPLIGNYTWIKFAN